MAGLTRVKIGKNHDLVDAVSGRAAEDLSEMRTDGFVCVEIDLHNIQTSYRGYLEGIAKQHAPEGSAAYRFLTAGTLIKRWERRAVRIDRKYTQVKNVLVKTIRPAELECPTVIGIQYYRSKEPSYEEISERWFEGKEVYGLPKESKIRAA